MSFEQSQSNSGNASGLSQVGEVLKKSGSSVYDTAQDVRGAVPSSSSLSGRFDRASFQKEEQECAPKYFVDIRNDPLKAELIKNAHEDGLKRLSFEEDDFFARERNVTKTLSAWSNMKINFKTDEEKARYERFLHYQSATDDRFISGEIYSVHTRIPTPEDSVVDDISYDKYLSLFFEACDQP